MSNRPGEEAAMSPVMTPAHRHMIELIISRTLQIGVFTSVALVLIGAILTFAHHPAYVHDPGALHRLITPPQGAQGGGATVSSAPADTTADFPTNVHDMFVGLGALRGQALIVLGLLVLIATPVVRVAISVLIFMVEKDHVFVGITLVVLALLLLSFFLGKAEV